MRSCVSADARRTHEARYAGRRASASPATGVFGVHQLEHANMLNAALTL